ncbi:OB-fold nucleic acid binding domain-containing protein [Phycisphaeraceae bacterium D3-23]
MKLDLKTLLAMPVLAIALGVGCDNNKAPSTQDGRTGPTTAEQDTVATPDLDDPAPLTDDSNDTRADPTPVVGGDHATDPPTPYLDAPPVPQRDPSPAANRRSPFPEEGEDFRGPLPATRLSDHDPFENLIDPEDIPDVVPWEQAGDYVGHEITVEGRIVNIGQTRNADVFFLNFHEDWRGKFYMVIFDDLADTLDQTVAEMFEGKLVRVQGLVEPHRGRPQIKIESMDQVEFVEE